MNTITHRTCVLLTGLGIGVLASSCRGEELNSDHCWNAQGNETCGERYGERKPYCGNEACSLGADYGCMAEMPKPECYSPCGGGKSEVEDIDCLEEFADEGTETGTSGAESESTGMGESTAESETESTETNESVGTTGEVPPCEGECDADLCVEETCVICTEADFSACMIENQFCNIETHQCEPCTGHHQCPNEAGCDIITKTCLPSDENRVIHVGLGFGQPSLYAAHAGLAGQSGTLIVHNQGMTHTLVETVVISGGQVVAIVAQEGRSTISRQDNVQDASEYAFSVSAGRLYLENLDIRGDAGVNTDGVGLTYLDAISIHTSRNAVTASDGETMLHNSMLSSEKDIRAITVLGGKLTAAFSTVAADSANALFCPPNCADCNVDIHNSILFADNFKDLECDFATSSNSAFAIGMCSPAWFVDFGTGDLHLAEGGIAGFAVLSMWATGDPLFDYDDDPRLPGDTIPGADIP